MRCTCEAAAKRAREEALKEAYEAANAATWALSKKSDEYNRGGFTGQAVALSAIARLIDPMAPIAEEPI